MLWANLHLLFWLSLFPFATGWMGENHFAAVPTAALRRGAADGRHRVLDPAAASIIASQGPDSILKKAVGRDWKGKLSPRALRRRHPVAFWSPWIAQAILRARRADLAGAGPAHRARACRQRDMTESPDRPTAAELARVARAGTAANAAHHGEVYLVGAGPGDPELLTLRALKLMERAEVVLYDNLVSDGVLDSHPAGVERIYVGKRRANHTLRQEEINELLVRYAQAGKRVVRLKGGDPFMFGRGGEEIDSLAANGIRSRSSRASRRRWAWQHSPAFRLTHRDHAQACLFVTGHLKDGSMDLDWPALARPRQTVVVYMGLLCLPVLCAKLIEHGQSRDLPAAVVQQGTAPTQRVVTGTLATLPDLAERAQLHGPTLIIVGDVVRLRERLNWFHPGADAASPPDGG